MTSPSQKKNQQLAITLIADSPTLFEHKQLFEQLMGNQCSVEYAHLHQLGAQHSLVMIFSGSWEHIAKLELQIKKHCTAPKMALNLLRGQYTQATTSEQRHVYRLVAISEPDEDLSHDFIDFFTENEVSVVNLDNQLSHNRQGSQVRHLTMRLAVPTDTHLTALHEAVHEILDDHNADGSFRIEC